MAELKTKQNNASVSDFIKKQPANMQADIKALLALMQKATHMKPKMWGSAIVGFGSYHYKSERTNREGDWMLSGFSPRKANLTVYIMSGAQNYTTLLKKLGTYKVSGGSCIYIKKMADINTSVLATIVKNSVRDIQKKYKKISS